MRIERDDEIIYDDYVPKVIDVKDIKDIIFGYMGYTLNEYRVFIDDILWKVPDSDIEKKLILKNLSSISSSVMHQFLFYYRIAYEYNSIRQTDEEEDFDQFCIKDNLIGRYGIVIPQPYCDSR